MAVRMEVWTEAIPPDMAVSIACRTESCTIVCSCCAGPGGVWGVELLLVVGGLLVVGVVASEVAIVNRIK